MTTVLATHNRRAAHGKHLCWMCGRRISANEVYEDQRCADSGTAYTVRSHLACVSAYHSWHPDYEGGFSLQDLSDGHLPPCPLAWEGAASDTHCVCAVPCEDNYTVPRNY